jgi:3-deoxy-D-manno-octulosonic-acid transferase
MAGFVTHFFVQDEESKTLLQQINITNVTVSGDTRFDRVWTNAESPKSFPMIAEFKHGHKILVAGSTWPEDEALLAQLVKDNPGWKFIIAPHEISDEKINKLVALLPLVSAERYSQVSNLKSDITNHDVLIIDNIGTLSSLYQYGDIAYVGGGFGAGIHNTLEAAAFGLPVIFGPDYKRFKEARDLVSRELGFSIKDSVELKAAFSFLAEDETRRENISKRIKDYVREHTGATETIMKSIKPS